MNAGAARVVRHTDRASSTETRASPSATADP